MYLCMFRSETQSVHLNADNVVNVEISGILILTINSCEKTQGTKRVVTVLFSGVGRFEF